MKICLLQKNAGLGILHDVLKYSALRRFQLVVSTFAA